MPSFIIIAVLLFLFILFVLLFFKPKYGLFLFLLSRPVLDNIDILRTAMLPGLGMNVLKLIGIIVPLIMISVCFLKKMDGSEEPVYFFKYTILNIYMLFLVFCLPALLMSNDLFIDLGEFLRLLTLWIVIIFATNFIKNEQDIKQVFVVILLASLYPMFRFSLDIVLGNKVLFNNILRYLGGYFHQSIISCLLLSFIPPFIYFYKASQKKINKVLLGTGIIFLMVSIYVTYYRTALLGLVGFLLSYALIQKRYKLLPVLCLIAVLATIFIPALRQRVVPIKYTVMHISDLFNPRPGPYDTLLSGRFYRWRLSLVSLKNNSEINNFLFGFGFNPSIKKIGYSFQPHNDFIRLMVENGIIAAIIFYWFLLKFMRLAWKNRDQLYASVIFPLFVGLFVMSMAHVTFSDVRNLLFLGVYMSIIIRINDFTIIKQGSSE